MVFCKNGGYIYNEASGNWKKSLNPLGWFKGNERERNSVEACIHMAGDEADFIEIFKSVLIDLPVGNYFRLFINDCIMDLS